jgi:hypothetical protein
MSTGVNGAVPAYDVLGPDERVVVRAHTNRARQRVWAAVFGAIGLANVVLALIAASRGDAYRAAGCLVWAAVVFGACVLVVTATAEVVVTNERIIVRGRQATNLREVYTIALRQTNSGRRRNYGDVILRSSGRRLTLRMITNAGEVQQAVLNGSRGQATPVPASEWGRIGAFAIIYGVFFLNVFLLR